MSGGEITYPEFVFVFLLLWKLEGEKNILFKTFIFWGHLPTTSHPPTNKRVLFLCFIYLEKFQKTKYFFIGEGGGQILQGLGGEGWSLTPICQQFLLGFWPSRAEIMKVKLLFLSFIIWNPNKNGSNILFIIIFPNIWTKHPTVQLTVKAN